MMILEEKTPLTSREDVPIKDVVAPSSYGYGSVEKDTDSLLKDNSFGASSSSSAPAPRAITITSESQQLPRSNGCEPIRLLILFCICSLTFGSYWVFDTPGAIPTKLNDYFEQKHKSLSPSENLTFYSVYSWPNTVLALFGGIILDRVTGIRFGCILFCALVFIGQATFATGIILRSFPLALIGRFIFGLGGESLTVAQNSFTVKWFQGGKYLALAFGTVVSFARIGTSVNFLVTPTFADIGVPFAVLFGVGACAFSFTMCIILSSIDLWTSKNRPHMLAADNKKPGENDAKNVSFVDVLRQVKRITLSAWILNLICMFFYVGVLTFNTVASKIMQNTGSKYSESKATHFMAIPNFVSVVASPLFGLMVDRYGRAMLWMSIACCMMIISMLCFLGNATGYLHLNPIPLMLWQGLGYSLGASAIWPSLAHVVAPEILSTAYGMMTSVQNLGMAVFPQVIGFLQASDMMEHHSILKYTLPILIFVVCEGTALCLTLFLFVLDKRTSGGKLNMSAKQRQQMEEVRKSQEALEEGRKLLGEQTLARARDRQELMKKAAAGQAQLLQRDVMTSRSMYYARLNIRSVPVSKQPFIYRPSFT